eukprot:gene830-9080_t
MNALNQFKVLKRPQTEQNNSKTTMTSVSNTGETKNEDLYLSNRFSKKTPFYALKFHSKNSIVEYIIWNGIESKVIHGCGVNEYYAVNQAAKLVLETIYPGLTIEEIYEFLSIKESVLNAQDITLVPSLLISDFCKTNELKLPKRIKKMIKGGECKIFLELTTKNNVVYFGEGIHKDHKIAERIASEVLLFHLFPQTTNLSQIHQMLFTHKKMKLKFKQATESKQED